MNTMLTYNTNSKTGPVCGGQGNDSKLITIYRSQNKVDYLIIEALLNSADIEYFSLTKVSSSTLISSASIPYDNE